MFYKDLDPCTAFCVILDSDPTLTRPNKQFFRFSLYCIGTWNLDKDNMDNFTVRACKKYSKLYVCRWFRFAQLAKGKKFRP